MSALPALAQITITIEKPLAAPNTLESRHPYRLAATHADGRPRHYRWSVDEPAMGTFRVESGRPGVRFRPASIDVPRVLHVRATDPATGETSGLEVRVVPRSTGMTEAARHALALTAALHGPTLGLPEMTLLPILPGAAGSTAAIEGVHWVGDKAMGRLDQAWLAFSHRAIWSFRGPGTGFAVAPQASFLPDGGATGVSIQGMTVRPDPSDPGNPRHVVVLVSTPPIADSPSPQDGLFLCEMGPDGQLTLIADGPGMGRGGYDPGPPFGLQKAGKSFLCMDRRGNVYAAQGDRIVQVGTDGQVRRVGAPLADALGPTPVSKFSLIKGIASDPETGNLYVLGWGWEHRGCSLWRISPDGNVTTLLVHRTPIQAGRPILADHAEGLAFHRGILYICDRSTYRLLAYEPATGILRTVAGDPSQPGVHPGPLGGFAPHAPASACAALGGIRAVAVHGSTVLVCNPLEDAMLRLEIPEDAFRTVPVPEKKEAKDGPAVPGEGK